jgi:5-hydroxyisourate hydrolase
VRIIAHIFDGSYGKSAVGVRARLEHAASNGWTTVAEVETNSDGCIEDRESWHLDRGLYRIVFDSDRYFAGLGAGTAYPEVAVIFRMQDDSAAFQMEVTLAPYSYSTYFGTIDPQPEHSG